MGDFPKAKIGSRNTFASAGIVFSTTWKNLEISIDNKIFKNSSEFDVKNSIASRMNTKVTDLSQCAI